MQIKQFLSGAFWLVMAIHFVVFSIIGFAAGKWRLLLIFVPFLLLSVLIKYLVYKRRR
ncbi:MAG: hypothetical protein LBR64_02395 [Dysgonamonadaceae bacterium]|nr:hypothetical protein [Dysgonamonadaceae bacterium]